MWSRLSLHPAFKKGRVHWGKKLKHERKFETIWTIAVSWLSLHPALKKTMFIDKKLKQKRKVQNNLNDTYKLIIFAPRFEKSKSSFR